MVSKAKIIKVELKSNYKLIMDRRKVLSWFGLGGVLSSFPAFLTACFNSQPSSSPQSTTSGTKGEFRVVGTVAQLQQAGQLKADGVVVVPNPNNSAIPLAVNPTCTHKGCTVDWKSDRQEFVCPCHSATYAPDGKVKKPPAPQSLASYAVKVENNQVLIASK